MSRFCTVGIPSKASWSWLAGGAGVMLVWFALVRFRVGGEFGTAVISDVADLLISVTAATLTLMIAATTRSASPGGSRRWMLVGLGIASYAVGSLIWSSYEIIARVRPPYPGWADAFYMLQYPLIAAALIGAGMSYRGLLHVRKHALVVTVFSIAACTALWILVLGPTLSVPGMSPLHRFVSAFYPLADIALGIGPALFVLLIVVHLGGAKLGWPWISVAVGVLLLTVSDTAYAVANAEQAYRSGEWLDYGWSAGQMLIAFGALIAGDLTRSISR